MRSAKPAELSGGQKQRVAIARSLINRPKILLLDEPLGALDLQLRRQMQQELKRLQKKLGITFIYITHDQEEALNMSDRIAVMRDGQFDQIGTPSQVYDSPRTAYVARFVGEANIVRGTVGAVSGDRVEFLGAGGKAAFLSRGRQFTPGEPAALAVRGEQAQALPGKEGPGLPGVVKERALPGACCASRWSLPAGRSLSAAATASTRSLPPGTPCASLGSRTRPARWRGRRNSHEQGALYPEKRQRRGEFLTALPLVLFTLLFIVGPMVYMVALSFMTRAETWGVVPQFTLKNYAGITEPVYLSTFWESLKLAVISTVLIIAIGYPFGGSV